MSVSVHGNSSDVVAGGLRIVVSEVGPTTTIALEGEWDLAGRDATRAVIFGVLDRQPECLVLDLSQLTFIDSTGIHDTLELRQRSAALNIAIAIVPGPSRVRRTFEICQLTELLPFLPTGAT